MYMACAFSYNFRVDDQHATSNRQQSINMRAAFFKGKDQPLSIESIKKFKPVKDQVLVRLNHAALNHRDLWIMSEQANVTNPQGVILGSDGCGVIEDVGEDADSLMIGMEVII